MIKRLDKISQLIHHVPENFKGREVGDERNVVFLDTETTGLEWLTCDIIELGMKKVSYSPSEKRLVSCIDSFNQLEATINPLPEKIIEITGITDEMLIDQEIDDAAVELFLEDVDLIVAHNASFDRPFFNKRFPSIDNGRIWSCSRDDVTWSEATTKLEWLVFRAGYYYDAHRAIADCEALAWLMRLNSGAFAQLLDRVSQSSFMVYATKFPFSCNAKLKANGYRWNQSQRVWAKNVLESELKEEKLKLNKITEFGGSIATVVEVDQKKRFL
jgi:DNA polymerase-3 subunit epsilon